jgi:lipopolysaccharide/colanic/teichoic acid biosynthesis glycosyltransferase
MNRMQTALRPRTFILFAGDLFFFIFALWVSLYLRAFDVPSRELFLQHLAPFSLLFVVWVVVFFIAGLYESRSIILARRALSATLLSAQVFNIAIAALFFFFVPIFGIAPKTVLLIYLVVSFLLVLLWRAFIFPHLGQQPEAAIVVGAGQEIDELVDALRKAHRAPARIADVIRPSGVHLKTEIEKSIQQYHPGFIIADFNNKEVSAAFPELYNYLSSGIRFFDAMTLYEEVFGRVPLSVIDDRWLAQNVSRYSRTLYDTFKRIADLLIAFPAAVVSLVFYPFIALALKLQDGGAILISMPRVGEGGHVFSLSKFRSMTGNDSGQYGEHGTTKLHVTRVGKFLRVTRLDELPQLWSVVRGDLAFVGPRPEVPSLVNLYEKEIPYYGVRHLVKPGLSGWAQLYGQHAHHGVGMDETRDKLSHDLYYIKHRSLVLDLTIAVKTIKKLLTRSGA